MPSTQTVSGASVLVVNATKPTSAEVLNEANSGLARQ